MSWLALVIQKMTVKPQPLTLGTTSTLVTAFKYNHIRLSTRMGVETIRVLSEIPVEMMINLLGRNGIELWRRANGIDETPIVPYHEAKSVGTENTFESDTVDISFLHRELVRMKGNVYKGRKERSKEDVLKFLSEEKNKKVLEYLKKSYKAIEISKIVGVNINTITKIKKAEMGKMNITVAMIRYVPLQKDFSFTLRHFP